MSAALHFDVLGPLTVSSEGVSVRLGGPRERLMLAALLVNANRVVSVDHLIDAIWDHDLPARPTATLQVHVSNLRRRLGDGAPSILTQPPGYIVPATADDVDLLHVCPVCATAANPAPISTPLTALMLIMLLARSASSLSYTGSPQPTGTFDRDRRDLRADRIARLAQLVHELFELRRR